MSRLFFIAGTALFFVGCFSPSPASIVLLSVGVTWQATGLGVGVAAVIREFRELARKQTARN